MSIRSKEKALFKKWSNDRPSEKFVWDGVICEEHYKESNPKLLFVLKEPRDWGDDDIRTFIRTWEQDRSWDNVARWAYGIRNRGDLPGWWDFPDVNSEFRKGALQSVAVMNLKKSPGGASADNAEVGKAAERDSDMVKEQFELYCPDITVCCGGIGDYFLSGALGGDFQEENWKCTYGGVRYYKLSVNRWVVDFAHPSQRARTELMLYPLVYGIQEIYGEKIGGRRLR